MFVIAGLIAGAIHLANKQANSAMQISRTLAERTAPARELAALAKGIRYHVVQVQQFLTDASVIRKLDEGEKDAAEHAAAFGAAAARAETLGARARECGGAGPDRAGT